MTQKEIELLDAFRKSSTEHQDNILFMARGCAKIAQSENNHSGSGLLAPMQANSISCLPAGEASR